MAVATASEVQKTAPSATTTTTMAAYFCSANRVRPTPCVSTRPSVPASSSPASERAATTTANPMSAIGASQESSSTFT